MHLTYEMMELVDKRIAHVEHRLDRLRPNQHSRRYAYEQELKHLNVCAKIMQDAQTAEVVSLTERLKANQLSRLEQGDGTSA